MKARFTLEALHHINAIHFYIAGRSPRAATHIANRIFADCERLAEFPRIGHRGMVSRTYEWTVAGLPYIVVYEIDTGSNEIIVLGVFHGAQDR
jgi:plasmid stabilization system protein ParE